VAHAPNQQFAAEVAPRTVVAVKLKRTWTFARETMQDAASSRVLTRADSSEARLVANANRPTSVRIMPVIASLKPMKSCAFELQERVERSR
jgi:hypothetical protein